jgi:regulator of sigma E protease
MIFRKEIPKSISGIVGIAQLTHGSVQQGCLTYLRLVALLSLSRAILNILPFPALDGGRMRFVLYEMATGFPVNRRLEIIVNSVGILLIMALMAAVTWNDIAKIISASSIPPF